MAAELYAHADLLYSSPRFRQVVKVAASEIGLEWDDHVLQEILHTPPFQWFFATYGEWAVQLLEAGRDRDASVVASIDSTIRDGVAAVKTARTENAPTEQNEGTSNAEA